MGLIEAYEDDQCIYLVMDVMADDLHNVMISCNQPFDEHTALKLFTQILEGVAYCHKNRVVHRDIKLENFFLDFQEGSKEITIKLGDFGVAAKLDCSVKSSNANKALHGMIGTPAYMAPEVFLNQRYGPKADSWSLGVLLFELLTNEHPYSSECDADNESDFQKEICIKTIQKVMKLKSSPLLQKVSPEAVDLICQLLTPDPARRLSAQDALQHSWIRKV